MKAVLFDLDGTLLDIDLDGFLRRYFAALEDAAGTLPFDGPILPALAASVDAMGREHAGRTNREVFYEDFLARTGLDLDIHWPVFEDFYRDVFPTLAGRSAPARGAAEAVALARELGLRVAVATNPIFPVAAVEHRLAWAGIRPESVDLVTTYETMHACKPLPAYFLQVASMLEVTAEDCLMVGDDPTMDMAASNVGMKTYFVGTGEAPADYAGDLLGLARLMPSIVGVL